jgi:hypothetical protein
VLDRNLLVNSIPENQRIADKLREAADLLHAQGANALHGPNGPQTIGNG